MKTRLIYLGILLGVVAAVLGFQWLDRSNGDYRYHQHLEERVPPPCTEHGSDVFCSHLPLIFIETGGEAIPGAPIATVGTEELFTTTASGETALSVSFRVVDQPGVNHHLDDDATLVSQADIRIRGNSSRYFDKKSYLLRPTDEEGLERKVSMLGMEEFDEWVLYGPYLDKSMIRNYMWYNIAGEIMDYAPNVRFCEVFLDGAYQGLYVLTESISSGKDTRLGLTRPSNNTAQVSYVLRLDRGSSNPVKNIETFSQYTLRNLQDIDIVYPGAKQLTPERIAFIQQDFSAFEKSLYSFDYNSPTEGYEKWLDTQSFVDYFILNEFTCNYDAGWLSTYVYKDLRGKLKACIWDFNAACDNYAQLTTAPQRFELQQNVWYFMLVKDQAFNRAIINRYHELRRTYLSDDYLNQYMDALIQWLGPAIDRNFQVWGYTLEMDMIFPSERNPRSQQEATDQMRSFIQTRGAWMDENIEILLQYGHPSKVKKFNH